MEAKGKDSISIDGDVFQVLVNDEEQHSIWPAAKAVPAGWTSTGPKGAKAECLDYIEKNWTDMRPRSLQLAMEQEGRAPAKEAGSGT